MTIWDRLRHFKANERWGNPGKMSWALLFILDELRDRLPDGCYIHINCAYENEGHTSRSFHSREDKGGAVDFVVHGLPFHIAFEFLVKNLSEMNIIHGLGTYPNWNTPGFHLDIRDSSLYWIAEGRPQTYRYYTESRDVLNKLINMGIR